MSDASDTASNTLSEETSTADLPLPLDLLKDIPEEKRAELMQWVSQIEVFGHFSGPLPPPNVLNLYDPDTRRIIVAESVENRRHRTKSESRSQVFFFVKDILSLIVAFTLALVLIVGSIDIIRSGQSMAGLLGMGGTVSVIAGAFIYRDRHKRREREADQNSPSPTEFPGSDGD